MSSDSGAPDRPANGRRRALSTPAVRIALSVLAIAVSAALVLLSPFALRAYGPDGSDSDWQRVGNVAQAYGAVSALIAGLALAGVGASLVFQARESKANREQGMRTAHTELMRMAIRLAGHSPSGASSCGATYVPRCGTVKTNPSSTSTAIARRTVVRASPYCCTSWVSLEMARLGCQSPRAMRARRMPASCW